MIELRCPHRKFGEVITPGSATVEISCPSRWCGKSQGVVVLHLFSITNGELLSTRQFRSPERGHSNASGK